MEEEGSREKLDWKDYVAIIIALLETIYLPLIILMLLLFFIAIALTFITH